MTWTEDARDRATVRDVATALGLDVRRCRGVEGFTCPIHGADHSDGRPSGRIVHRGAGWKCWTCDQGGDVVTLACIVLKGERSPRGEAFHHVRAWFAARGWCEAWEGGAKPRKAPEPPRRAPRPVEADPVPVRHPVASVAAVWGSLDSVISEARCGRWLRCRGLEPWRVASLDLARGIGPTAVGAEWARLGRSSWGDAGWSLVLPVYDAEGVMCGLRARWTGTRRTGPDYDDDVWPTPDGLGLEEVPPPYAGKEVSPSGGGVSAAVYADPVGRWLLSGGFGPVDPSAPGLRWNGRVLVVEGGPAWLHYAAEPGRVSADGSTAAVLGVWSGAWRDDRWGRALARRFWRASSVVVAGDDDEGGERIADPVVRVLSGAGIPVRRVNRRDA